MGDGKRRRQVFYSGHVQGVGFRYTTRRIASRFDVVGFVRNLPDRRVQVVVEGREAEISSFLQEIATTFAGNVTDVEVQDDSSGDELTGFEIRY